LIQKSVRADSAIIRSLLLVEFCNNIGGDSDMQVEHANVCLVPKPDICSPSIPSPIAAALLTAAIAPQTSNAAECVGVAAAVTPASHEHTDTLPPVDICEPNCFR
jgi:hypothetical protein